MSQGQAPGPRGPGPADQPPGEPGPGARLEQPALGGLARGICHRVKNDLQTVSNVLALAAARGRSPEEMALAMEGRVNALAAAYALVAETSAAPTLDRLARETARRALAPAETPITPEIDLPAEHLSLRLCSPLCLWLHEAVTNARIHGLAGTPRPRLVISGNLGEGGLLLSVRDNGPGPPPGFDPGAGSGLGLVLAQALASRDLGGEMIFLDSRPGFEARLIAPAAEIARLNREFWI